MESRLGGRFPAAAAWPQLAGWSGAAIMLAAYAAIWLFGRPDLATLAAFWPFAPIGVFGAAVASSTGVGGGVVFVPVFNMMRETGIAALDPAVVVGTSFAIQCFGMSTGSLTWIARLNRPDATPGELTARGQTATIVALVMATALPSLLLAQRLMEIDGQSGLVLFKGFSIALGLLLLLQVLLQRNGEAAKRESLTRADQAALLAIGLAGGLATAMFSVGVGELLALYLFLRRYPLEVCVAPAVICSALSVLAGVGHHVANGEVAASVMVFAAPGVVLGGWVARRLAQGLGAFRLKLFAALWIVLSSLALIAMT